MLSRTLQAHSGANPVHGQEIADLLSALGNHFVAYYPVLADITRSPKAAIMLGHGMFMTRIVMNKDAARGGWFWKTAHEWEQATGLSVDETRNARKVLLSSGIMQESLRGMPAKLWYRVDLNMLAQKLCEHGNTKYRQWSWEDRVLKTVLGKPIMFYAPLAWLSESATAGLYLSYLLGCLRQKLQINDVGELGQFVTSLRQTQQKLYLGKHSVIKARTHLIQVGVLNESREHCAQSRLISHLNLAKITEKIGKKINEIHCLSFYDNQECRNTTNREFRFPQTESSVFPKQKVHVSPNREFRISQTCSGENGTLSYIDINTTYNTPLTPHTESVVGVELNDYLQAEALAQALPSGMDVSGLIFPDSILPNEKEEARRALQLDGGCPNPQRVLDEWCGQLQGGKVRNPIRYLLKLKTLDVQNALLCDHAHRIEAERERRKETLAQRSVVASVALPLTEIDKERGRLKMEGVRQMLRGTL